MNILETIANHRREEVDALKRTRPLTTFVNDLPTPASHSFRKSLVGDGTRIIAEIKQASPSKGLLAHTFDPAAIAKHYHDGGAAAISVLTEQRHFMGRPEYLQLVADISGLPVLCKDFVVDEYQVYYARLMRADAVLLIVRLLTPAQLTDYLLAAGEIGLDCLVEVHNEKELEIAVNSGCAIIGVNSRNLDDFTVSLDTAERLAALIPKHTLKVAESGITTRADISRLRSAGFDAFLIGEALMTAPDPVAHLKFLRGA